MRGLGAIISLLSVLLVGCSSDGKWKPELPHPTREEIMAMAKQGPPVEVPIVPLQLYTTPRIVMSYITVRLTCTLPTNVNEGRYFMGIDGLFSQEAPIWRKEITYLFKSGCMPLIAYCGYSEYVSPTGFQKPKRIELKIEPAGDCR